MRSVDKDNSYDSEDLVQCPKCGYFCREEWGECPICNTALQIAGGEENLLDCPNPKCDYTCRSDWDACPICNTKLPSKQKLTKLRKQEKAKTTKKIQKKTPSQPVVSLSQGYCISCGKKVASKQSSASKYYCVKCQNNPEKDKNIHYCSNCGKKTTSKFKFCVHCYHSFVKPNKKYDKYDVDELYELSAKSDKIYKFLLVFCVQFVLIALFIANLVLELGFADVIEFDLWDYFIAPLVFAPLLVYYHKKRLRLKKERIARDKYYRIKIATIQNRLAKSSEIPSGKKGQLWKKFRQTHFNDIKEHVTKSQFRTKLRIYFWYIFIVLMIVSIISIMITFTIFLASVIGTLSCLYFIIRKAHVDPLTEAFRLGLQYTEDEFMAYILYVIAQLYNLIPVSKKER